MSVCGRPSFGLPIMSVYLESTWSPKGDFQKKRVSIGTLAIVLLLEIFHRASKFLLFRLHTSDCLVSLGTCSTVDLIFV